MPSNHNLDMRIKYELEYALNCSPKMIWPRLSTPDGLSEWFADEVNVDGNTFSFRWNKTVEKAKLASVKEFRLARFEWEEENNDSETNFFEFKITVHDLTGDLSLLITDFAEPDEKDDEIYLWDTQINNLKRALGI